MRVSTTSRGVELALLAWAGWTLVGCSDPAQPRRATAIVAAAAATAAGDEPLPGRPPTRAERHALERLGSDAERIRGLRFRERVPVRVQTSREITDFVRSRIDREELERARTFYLALGLLPPEIDIESTLLAVMGEQVVGYYDPEQTLLVVRDDVLREVTLRGREVQGASVLVHELVHALQDQHLGLSAQYAVERSIDEANAFASLVEGDAALSMIGWALEAAGRSLDEVAADPANLRRMVALGAATSGGAALDAAPAIVRVPLLSRYLDGMVFCAHLHGGHDFRQIDAAFADPPMSTEQVLHPDAYTQREPPEAVVIPPLPEFEASGLTQLEEDTLGELEMGVYFAIGTPLPRDAVAADGWGGDRARVYVAADGSTTLVWFTTWDDEAEAIEAHSAAVRVAATAPGGPSRTHLVQRQGRTLLIARDLASSLHPILLEALDAFASALGPSRAGPRTVLDARIDEG